MVAAVAISRTELDASGLRRAAGRERDAAASRRMLALALVLEGSTRTEAARAAGMDRQTLRDWVHRYNAEGLAGLRDRVGETGPKRRLSPEQEAELAEWVRRGPDLAIDGVVRWRLIDLAQWIFEEFRITIAKQTLSRELRAMGYRKLSARPRHHAQAEGAIEDFKKTSPRAWRQLRARRRLTATR